MQWQLKDKEDINIVITKFIAKIDADKVLLGFSIYYNKITEIPHTDEQFGSTCTYIMETNGQHYFWPHCRKWWKTDPDITESRRQSYSLFDWPQFSELSAHCDGFSYSGAHGDGTELRKNLYFLPVRHIPARSAVSHNFSYKYWYIIA